MPRKTLDTSRSVVGFRAEANKQAPRGLGGWLLCLVPTLRGGSCQEYRGINAVIVFLDYDFYFDIIGSSRKNRKAPIFIGTGSGWLIKIDFDFIIVKNNILYKIID